MLIRRLGFTVNQSAIERTTQSVS